MSMVTNEWRELEQKEHVMYKKKLKVHENKLTN